MSTSPEWSESAEENTAVAELAAVVNGMAGLLHTVPDARYADPSGGYTPGR